MFCFLASGSYDPHEYLTSDKDDDDNVPDAPHKKKNLDSLKRKRTAGPANKPRKKPSKGPTTEIEYEYVPEPTQREMLVAK